MPRSYAWIPAATAALALAVVVPPAAAEAPSVPGAESELIRLDVRPGREADIEQFLARLAEAARRTGAPVRWRAHRRVDGERPLYVLVLQATSAEDLEAWGDLTASATLERAYGPEEARRLLALREEALGGMVRERFTARPELGFDD
jgi:hypothetical protein